MALPLRAQEQGACQGSLSASSSSAPALAKYTPAGERSGVVFHHWLDAIRVPPRAHLILENTNRYPVAVRFAAELRGDAGSLPTPSRCVWIRPGEFVPAEPFEYRGTTLSQVRITASEVAPLERAAPVAAAVPPPAPARPRATPRSQPPAPVAAAVPPSAPARPRATPRSEPPAPVTVAVPPPAPARSRPPPTSRSEPPAPVAAAVPPSAPARPRPTPRSQPPAPAPDTPRSAAPETVPATVPLEIMRTDTLPAAAPRPASARVAPPPPRPAPVRVAPPAPRRASIRRPAPPPLARTANTTMRVVAGMVLVPAGVVLGIAVAAAATLLGGIVPLGALRRRRR